MIWLSSFLLLVFLAPTSWAYRWRQLTPSFGRKNQVFSKILTPRASQTQLSFIKSSTIQSRKNTEVYLFDRFFRLIAANFNSLIKRFEDPEKIIEQAVLDMQNDLLRIRQSYAEVTATQRRFEKQRAAALEECDLWMERATTAMQKGNEPLAREALIRKNTQKQLVESLTKQLQVQTQASDKLYDSMNQLEQKIFEAKRQKEALIARARTAKTSLQVNEMLNSLTVTSSSMEAFNRMRDKVDSLEIQADIAGEMSGNPGKTSLEEQFVQFAGEDALETELAQLRRSSQLISDDRFVLPADLEVQYEQLTNRLNK